ncbi:MAG: rane protein of unknown function [Candidatus Saccharibacteria bacterium]|nr:rane protein of unknown function [Candidatus Saccharibacteria bacterium]
MNKIRNFVLVLGVILGIGLLAPTGAHAIDAIADQCKGVTDSAVCAKQGSNANDIIKTVINVLLFIVGAISVVMLIVGGLLYTTSAGDSARVTRAKNTVMYAIVGLVVSFLAFAIVNYVIKVFFK